MSVDIPVEIVDEIEEKQERERIAWRVSCRKVREQAKERELEAGEVSNSYTEVVATVGRGAVGDGRQSAHGWRGGKRYVHLMFYLILN